VNVQTTVNKLTAEPNVRCGPLIGRDRVTDTVLVIVTHYAPQVRSSLNFSTHYRTAVLRTQLDS
jgi:hypothetical protein